MPDDIQKWANEAAEKWREQYNRPVFACGYESAYLAGAQAMWEKLNDENAPSENDAWLKEQRAKPRIEVLEYYDSDTEKKTGYAVKEEPIKRVGFFDDQEG